MIAHLCIAGMFIADGSNKSFHGQKVSQLADGAIFPISLVTEWREPAVIFVLANGAIWGALIALCVMAMTAIRRAKSRPT
jgi:hypothetical protein